MALREQTYFLRNLRGSFTSIGALLPTSRYAARAMASEFARRHGARTVLEAGPGTGAITAAIVEQMRPGDRLVLCELNDEFVAYLRQRIDNDPAFRRVRGQITLIHGDVTQLDRAQHFDAIVSAIPFTNLPAEVVEGILETYREILKPGGTLTYIEYAFFRALKRRFASAEQRDMSEAASVVLDRYLHAHEFRRDTVVRNVPPAWIHHLRLQEPSPADALTLAPLEHNHRIQLTSSMAVASDALPWIAGLFAIGRVLPRPLRRLIWLLAAIIGAFFRDPVRHVAPDPGVAYAAADGRVLSIERVHDERFGDGEWLRIAVFLSLLDVHINRSPIAGKVEKLVQEEGGYAAADSADAEHNQALYTMIEGASGPCVVAQRAGLVARRIVNWSQPGELLAQGDRYGLIRFGSRTDVYLPAEQWQAIISVGDRVAGGETVIARRT